jgi:sugar phosphate isomerase/epimerase
LVEVSPEIHVHPRVSLNVISTWSQSLEADIALWADLGITKVGLMSPKFYAPGWDAGGQAVQDSGVQVSNMTCYVHEIPQALEFCAAVGCGLLYTVSGRISPGPWDEAAKRFCENTAPHLARAEQLGVKLAIEATNPLRCDESFVFTVRDSIDLARMAGIGIVFDFFSAWYERDVEKLVRDNIDLVTLVQFCDYKIGTYCTGIRFAVGDGDIPNEELMAVVLDAGYRGDFDLELLGPQLEAEGYRAPIARSIARASEILDRLGA